MEGSSSACDSILLVGGNKRARRHVNPDCPPGLKGGKFWAGSGRTTTGKERSRLQKGSVHRRKRGKTRSNYGPYRAVYAEVKETISAMGIGYTFACLQEDGVVTLMVRKGGSKGENEN